MKLNDMFPSKYIKADDLSEEGQVVTIQGVKQEMLKDPQTQREEAKWVLYFQELDRGLVLNKVNSSFLGKTCGDDTDDWTGKKVVIYQTLVEFKGDHVAGVRFRKATKADQPF